jgi:hypothetical protein
MEHFFSLLGFALPEAFLTPIEVYISSNHLLRTPTFNLNRSPLLIPLRDHTTSTSPFMPARPPPHLKHWPSHNQTLNLVVRWPPYASLILTLAYSTFSVISSPKLSTMKIEFEIFRVYYTRDPSN